MFKLRKGTELPGAIPGSPPSAGAGAPASRQELGIPQPEPADKSTGSAHPSVGLSSSHPFSEEIHAVGGAPSKLAPFSPPNAAPAASGIGAGLRSGAQPGAAREQTQQRTLVVGPGITLHGIVQDAERLVVQGTVDASTIHATELTVAQGGLFKGSIEVKHAEIAGTIDGQLTASGYLVVRGTGKVLGSANYRRLLVAEGAEITAELQLAEDDVAPQPAPLEI